MNRKTEQHDAPRRALSSTRSEDFDARDERDARKATRSRRCSTRSVGATAISMSGAHSIGLAHPSEKKPRGRGETARRVEESEYYAGGVKSRPAVYTGDESSAHVSLKDRIKVPEWSSFSTVPLGFVVALLAALTIAIVWGPVCTYYAAWREAGVLEATYEVVSAQNTELNDEVDRLQTIEGIELEARRRGYTYPNEEALVIDGLEEERLADPAMVEQHLAEYEESLPWYVHVLDVIMGYKKV